jgi:hypothetical protein
MSSSVSASELFSMNACDFVQAHCAGSFAETLICNRFRYWPSCGSPASGSAMDLNFKRRRTVSSKPSQPIVPALSAF